jgi:hypothetical protein
MIKHVFPEFSAIARSRGENAPPPKQLVPRLAFLSDPVPKQSDPLDRKQSHSIGFRVPEQIDPLDRKQSHSIDAQGLVLVAAGIKNHRAKPVKRSYMYHFQDPEVPVHSDYLKVAYSAEHAALPSDLAGEFIP